MITMTWPQYLRRQCTVDGRVVKLSPTQTEILLFLMLRPDWAPINDMIEFSYPDPDREPDCALGTMSVCIHRLRRRIGFHHIQNRFGGGYRLARDIKEAA